MIVTNVLEIVVKIFIDIKTLRKVLVSREFNTNSKEGLEFFEAHKAADVIHRKECEKLLDSLNSEEREKAEQRREEKSRDR